ncbi:MAG: SDR family oxidoreductase [Schlesneria sp.]
MRFLIFGCGYLGRRVAAAWVDAGHDVIAVTRNQKNAESFRQSGIQPIVADICDLDSLAILPEVDLTLHAVGFDRTSGRSQEEVTCGGLKNVLSRLKGRCSRFIYVSSTSVFGQSAGEWVDESSECKPTQPGGQNCLEAERLVWEYFPNTEAPNANVLRLAGIYGPKRLLSRIDSIKAGLSVAGRSNSWLNLIHVDDAASAVIACEKHWAPFETYIVVDDRPVLREEYYNLLAGLAGGPVPVFNPEDATARGSGGLNKRCSNKKLREKLRWAPAFPSIEAGLPASINSTTSP